MLPVAETFSGQEGQIRFSTLLPGEYIVETIESDKFEATATRVTIHPTDTEKPRALHVMVRVDLPTRKLVEPSRPGVILADVDVDVPQAALKHYRKAVEALHSSKSDEAVKELKAAIENYPRFYMARLELGRQLRFQKRFPEAEEALRPLGEIAPKRAESRVEYAIILLALRRAKDAAAVLRQALEIEDANWVTHLHLGWALLEDDPGRAEQHFKRALQLDESKGAQAHLSLARLAHARGARQETLLHLEAYLRLAPDAPDATAVRKLLGQLRKSQQNQ